MCGRDGEVRSHSLRLCNDFRRFNHSVEFCGKLVESERVWSDIEGRCGKSDTYPQDSTTVSARLRGFAKVLHHLSDTLPKVAIVLHSSLDFSDRIEDG